VLSCVLAAASLHAVTASRSHLRLSAPIVGPSSGTSSAVDALLDDDDTARELKNRSTDELGLVLRSASRPIEFAVGVALAAAPEPGGRVTFSLGPRAPPPAPPVDLWRLAWQA